MELRHPTGVSSKHAALLSANETSCLALVEMSTTAGNPNLSDFFSFDDFHNEYAAWLRQSDEGTSHADSGHFSFQSTESMEDVIENGKARAA